jgi:ABC-2 type transport system permease protein
MDERVRARGLRHADDRVEPLGVSQASDALARLKRWLRRLEVLAVKELKQCARDFVLMAFVAYSFVGAVYISGTGVTQDLRNASLLARDRSDTAASRDLLYRFREPYFHRVGPAATSDRASLARLDDGTAMLVLDIPADFYPDLQRGARSASVQLMIDTSNVTMGYLAAAYGDRIVAGFAQGVAERAARRSGLDPRTLPAVENESRIWFNPNVNGHWFNAIGEWLTMMTVIAMLLPATALVRERERGAVEQLLVAPLTPMQIMLSKALAMTLVSVTGTALTVYLVLQPLGVPFVGSTALFFATTALYVFSISGLGLLIGAFARSSAEVGMLVILVVVPMTALSGTWTAPEAMPGWSRQLLQVSALHHFIECAYGIPLRGAGIDTLWGSILAIALLGGVAFALAWLRLKRRLA